jgi:two-component system nitrate/nitrite response regulator NarL
MNGLTSREREVVSAVAEGLSNKEIGRRLNLSEGTVKVHLHNIYSRLGVKNRTALVVLAYTELPIGEAASSHASWASEAIEAGTAFPVLVH